MKILSIMLYLLPSLVFAGNLNNNRNNNMARSDIAVDNSRNMPVSSAFAPSYRPTSDCLMSGGIGAGKSSFSFTFGGSWQSKPCNIRAYASMFSDYPDISFAILCQDKIVRNGVEAAGHSCPVTKKVKKCDYPRPDQCRK